MLFRISPILYSFDFEGLKLFLKNEFINTIMFIYAYIYSVDEGLEVNESLNESWNLISGKSLIFINSTHSFYR